jgi:uncharacterized protein (UPF0216 family)
MQIIKDKQYDYEKENKELNFVSLTSNGTLCIVMKDGTHYNFNDKELKKILDFIKEKIK